MASNDIPTRVSKPQRVIEAEVRKIIESALIHTVSGLMSLIYDMHDQNPDHLSSLLQYNQ